MVAVRTACVGAEHSHLDDIRLWLVETSTVVVRVVAKLAKFGLLLNANDLKETLRRE